VRLTPIYRPRLYRIAHDARFFVDAALSHQETWARTVIHLLLAFNNSVRRSRPSCHLPVGARVMSGELVKLALAGAAASVLIWVLSLLAPHCVPEHVGNLIKLAAC
jgi:hypothetical protein